MITRNCLKPSNLISLARSFCRDFQKEDLEYAETLYGRLAYYKPYLKEIDKWKVPFERDQRLKAQAKENFKNYIQPLPQVEKLVVHDPMLPIELPISDNKIFAVVEINSFQHKVIHFLNFS